MMMMMFQCNTASTASQIVTDVEAGSLFGVSMGTTSKASSYSSWALVECTETRGNSISNADFDREDIQLSISTTAPESFTDSDGMEKMWYLRGKLV